MKKQMVDLFHRKPDVYNSCQVRMRISAILTPQRLVAEPPLDSGGVDNGDRPKSAGEFRH